MLHEYEISILNLLKKQKNSTLEELQEKLSIGRDSVVWAAENLAKGGLVKIERESRKVPKITEEGKRYLKIFPEEELAQDIKKLGNKKPINEIKNEIALIWAKKNGWIILEKGQATLTDKGLKIIQGNGTYEYKELLNRLNDSDPAKATKLIDENAEDVAELRKRNLLSVIDRGSINGIQITEKGLNAELPSEDGMGILTRDAIVTGKWKTKGFRPYDISASTEETYPARLHPMHELIDSIRAAWLNMGFTEVSGPIIESAFWNFDALFSPQDHPTRDMQDTFFLKNPKKISIEDIALMNRVKKMHTKNWKSAWKEELAQQALLRTHTTSVSARYINQFATNVNSTFPMKLFSIGKVFRNESIDYKHLAELHQCDGIIIGTNLTLSNLIFTLKEFYSQIGMNDIIVKPSYFPFVEPGLEIEYYDEEKQDTIELCGGGIIRKEITKAMGTNKTVLAWGGGIERLIFNALSIKTLPELYKNELGWLRERKELRL